MVYRRSILAVAAFALLVLPHHTNAATLTFEALGCGIQFAGSDGFTFSSNWVTQCDGDYAATWQNTTGAPSGLIAAGNTYAGDPADGVTITRATPFNLVGGMASAFLVNNGFEFGSDPNLPQSSATLLIEGYLNATFRGSVIVDFAALSPGYHPIAGSLHGVNELRFFSSFDQMPTGAPDYWLVDDLELTEVATAVPEPGTIAFLGPAAAMLLFGVRRRMTRCGAPHG